MRRKKKKSPKKSPPIAEKLLLCKGTITIGGSKRKNEGKPHFRSVTRTEGGGKVSQEHPIKKKKRGGWLAGPGRKRKKRTVKTGIRSGNFYLVSICKKKKVQTLPLKGISTPEATWTKKTPSEQGRLRSPCETAGGAREKRKNRSERRENRAYRRGRGKRSKVGKEIRVLPRKRRTSNLDQKEPPSGTQKTSTEGGKTLPTGPWYMTRVSSEKKSSVNKKNGGSLHRDRKSTVSRQPEMGKNPESFPCF